MVAQPRAKPGGPTGGAQENNENSARPGANPGQQNA